MFHLFLCKIALFFKGSIAVAGLALDWLKNNMGILENTTEDSEALATAVSSTGDVYFVPAFDGLYAPYWRTDARGCVSFNFISA